MNSRFAHGILRKYFSLKKRSFERALGDPESAQRKRLSEIIFSLRKSEQGRALQNQPYETLTRLLPVAGYEDYRSRIERQRDHGQTVLSADVVRYEPTSGSTSARKWIPYSRAYLAELNSAAAVWLADVYERYPGTRDGVHYWSLSWLPEELRKLKSNDDSELFPLFQRLILQRTQAVPQGISLLENPADAWWATLVTLAACEKLSLVSVWSPTFWLNLTRDLKSHWSEIDLALRSGSWGRNDQPIRRILGSPRKRDLGDLKSGDPDFFRRLWPNLSLISSWDSSSSAEWANEIKRDFSWVGFQGKGLWATEGVVTIPFRGRKVLSVNAHFYEFRDLASGEIVPSWQVVDGREYQPILWTSSGLLRYALADRLKVSGFLNKTPCFEFMGRLQSVDLVGEKIDAIWVETLFARHPEWRAISLVAVKHPSPRYVLLHRSEKPDEVNIEAALGELHHYQLARELGQLGPAENMKIGDALGVLSRIGQSQVTGQNKPEILISVEKLTAIESPSAASP